MGGWVQCGHRGHARDDGAAALLRLAREAQPARGRQPPRGGQPHGQRAVAAHGGRQPSHWAHLPAAQRAHHRCVSTASRDTRDTLTSNAAAAPRVAFAEEMGIGRVTGLTGAAHHSTPPSGQMFGSAPSGVRASAISSSHSLNQQLHSLTPSRSSVARRPAGVGGAEAHPHHQERGAQAAHDGDLAHLRAA